MASGRGQEKLDPKAYLKAATQWVDDMFAGPKLALRPLFKEAMLRARALGGDIRICPGKTIVPIYRRHVIAQLKPATGTRLDLGLSLGDRKPTKRLQDTGGLAKKDRITHRVALTSIGDLDSRVESWLREAYERDA